MHPDQLRPRRQMLRLSVADLARRGQVDKHTIHRIEDGTHSPTHATLAKIWRALIEAELALRDHLLALHPLAEAPMVREAAE